MRAFSPVPCVLRPGAENFKVFRKRIEHGRRAWHSVIPAGNMPSSTTKWVWKICWRHRVGRKTRYIYKRGKSKKGLRLGVAQIYVTRFGCYGTNPKFCFAFGHNAMFAIMLAGKVTWHISVAWQAVSRATVSDLLVCLRVVMKNKHIYLWKLETVTKQEDVRSGISSKLFVVTCVLYIYI